MTLRWLHGVVSVGLRVLLRFILEFDSQRALLPVCVAFELLYVRTMLGLFVVRRREVECAIVT